jgi:hypothetical protein
MQPGHGLARCAYPRYNMMPTVPTVEPERAPTRALGPLGCYLHLEDSAASSGIQKRTLLTFPLLAGTSFDLPVPHT